MDGAFDRQPDMELKGSLNMAISANGTLGSPRLSGSLNGKDLAVNWLSMGVNLSRGELVAVLNGNQVQIQKGIIYGPEGNLQLTGGVQLNKGQISTNLQFKTDKLLVLSNVDRQLAITGQGHFSLDKDRLQLIGDWYVNRATNCSDRFQKRHLQQGRHCAGSAREKSGYSHTFAIQP